MYLDQKYTHNVWIMFESVFCVGGQDVVEWKKKTLPILKFQQWQKVNECRWDGSQSTYQAALVVCKNLCKIARQKRGMLSSHGYLSMLTISDSQHKSENFKLLTSCHSLRESAQIPVNI